MDAKAAILTAMGYDLADTETIAAALRADLRARYGQMLPPVCVNTLGQAMHCELSLPSLPDEMQINWALLCEDGQKLVGSAALLTLNKLETVALDDEVISRWQLELPGTLALGYHQLTVTLATGLSATTTLIVAPASCYEPEKIMTGARHWGFSIQLYTLRSEQNWGIGDFHDLHELMTITAPLGCALVGVNPLHALRPADPDHISPYSPSSRQFLNVLYLAVPWVAEFAACDEVQAYVNSAAVQLEIARLRATENVDYKGVAMQKFAALRLLHQHFRQQHLAKDSARAKKFRHFVIEQGQALVSHALYDALDLHLAPSAGQSWGWQSWPLAYQDPQSVAVQNFKQQQPHEIEFFMYLQWLATEQLADVQALALTHGMSIGVYADVAVGVNPNGAESWANKALYLNAVAIGAPPDPLALKGQDWGIPPQNPTVLRAQAYKPFINMLRSNMRQAGALRIDHVMSLCRLWWVPRGFSASDGVYMHYPLAELMSIVALESVRNRCLVVGEDLGTVPDEMRIAMQCYAVYHYKVMLFEKDSQGQFKTPQQYVRPALATVTTHDLPPLRSWWEEHDIALRDRLQLYPDQEAIARVRNERQQDRYALITALVDHGLWYWQPHEALPPYSFALQRATSLYLGSSAAALVALQLEDLLGMSDPVNVPGTHVEHANWQRKLYEPTSNLFKKIEVQEMLQALCRVREERK